MPARRCGGRAPRGAAALAAAVFCCAVVAVPVDRAAAASGQDAATAERLDRLEERVGDLERALEEKDAQIRELRRRAAGPEGPGKRPGAGGETPLVFTPPGGDIQVGFGGQYRVNSYAADNDLPGDHPTASRVRIRQDLDFRFGERLRSHLELELGHTNDNLTTTPSGSRATTVGVRHAVVAFAPLGLHGPEVRAGILPLSDRFGDVLFSADWDYNPVGVEVRVPLGPVQVRGFAADLHEGAEPVAHDDFDHYQLDLQVRPAPGLRLTAGLSFLDAATPDGHHTRRHWNYGAGVEVEAGPAVAVRACVLGSRTDGRLLGVDDPGQGCAAKLEVTAEAGPHAAGLMATYASGERDGSGFLPVMALSRTYGYWGYTGLLTVQGATDTGIDESAVNISNNGYGLVTVQAYYTHRFESRFSLRLAAGWFGASHTPRGRSSELGIDTLVMGTWRLHRYLTLDLGVAYAHLRDGISGYWSGVGPAGFVAPAGARRDKTAAFSRLQLAF
ncbi:hypothetical protein G3N55_09015 [Dissulfurirhabdus thermomarina]|uniref:Porin n=1 Tax=Dissulfurirhabdus thermomarina TaxID=1765737 RepID=A0A6N9TP83_DISTH|nr:outer membrane beta-barrel protein [Dissulfurirhabdus thermomarina]NDY42979.1 hypothetical protein [Dissulfurirhabdus thermomarina]NMX23796.1 hypothetical protein [Dissulfurirhabdus thermomarina]